MAKTVDTPVQSDETEEVSQPVDLIEIYSPLLTGEMFTSWDNDQIVSWRKATGEIIETLKQLNKRFDEVLQDSRKVNPAAYEGVEYFRKPRESAEKSAVSLLDKLRKS